MKLLISFKEFASDPVKGLLFLALMAIAYMYFDQRSFLLEQIEKHEQKIERLEDQVFTLQNKLIEAGKALEEWNT